MISFFKEYAYTLLLISIFILFLEMVIRKNTYKKYIMLFVSILLLMQFVKPVINLFEQDSLEESVADVYKNITEDIKIEPKEMDINKIVKEQNDKVLKEAISKIKNDIENKCTEYGIEYKSVIISTSNDLEVSDIVIKIKSKKTNTEEIKKILKYISETYNVNEKIIKVEEEIS